MTFNCMRMPDVSIWRLRVCICMCIGNVIFYGFLLSRHTVKTTQPTINIHELHRLIGGAARRNIMGKEKRTRHTKPFDMTQQQQLYTIFQFIQR